MVLSRTRHTSNLRRFEDYGFLVPVLSIRPCYSRWLVQRRLDSSEEVLGSHQNSDNAMPPVRGRRQLVQHIFHLFPNHLSFVGSLHQLLRVPKGFPIPSASELT